MEPNKKDKYWYDPDDLIAIPPWLDRRGEIPKKIRLKTDRSIVMPDQRRIKRMQAKRDKELRAIKRAEAKDLKSAERVAEAAQKAAGYLRRVVK
jgi:hypothetical protein